MRITTIIEPGDQLKINNTEFKTNGEIKIIAQKIRGKKSSLEELLEDKKILDKIIEISCNCPLDNEEQTIYTDQYINLTINGNIKKLKAEFSDSNIYAEFENSDSEMFKNFLLMSLYMMVEDLKQKIQRGGK